MKSSEIQVLKHWSFENFSSTKTTFWRYFKYLHFIILKKRIRKSSNYELFKPQCLQNWKFSNVKLSKKNCKDLKLVLKFPNKKKEHSLRIMLISGKHLHWRPCRPVPLQSCTWDETENNVSSFQMKIQCGWACQFFKLEIQTLN